MLHNSPNSPSCLLWCSISSLPCSVLPSLQLACSPSPVQNHSLSVNFVLDLTNSQIIANLSWLGPEAPYGKVDHYKLVLSSPRAATLPTPLHYPPVCGLLHLFSLVFTLCSTLVCYFHPAVSAHLQQNLIEKLMLIILYLRTSHIYNNIYIKIHICP